MNKNHINTEIINSINNFFMKYPNVVAVYMFGSAAEGNQTPLSDIDIGLLFNRDIPAVG